jgi:hypothetical protein
MFTRVVARILIYLKETQTVQTHLRITIKIARIKVT